MTDEITLDAPETRIERFLAAALGMEGVELDEPQTRIERYLYTLAQKGGVPAVEDADKGKYLHANESTGDLEWATAGGSGGGVLVVHDVSDTLDKTWQEIYDAILSGGAVIAFDGETIAGIIESAGVDINQEYQVTTCFEDIYMTATADGYPTLLSK